MAKCAQTAAQFITEAFRPRIAVMSSPEVEAICMKNDLTLTELLQPFCKVNQDVQYRDPLNSLVTVRDLHLALDDWSLSAPPPAHVARRQLAECVAQSLPPPTGDDGAPAERPESAPWFEAWRQRLLQVEPPGEHEFARRYVACVLAVSSAAAAPLQQLQQLAQHQHQQQHGQPAGGARWFSNNVLIYHLLVTDSGATPVASAEAVFEQVKSAYGAHCCHHLRLNSRRPEHREPHQPDPWAGYVLRRPTNLDGTPAQLSGTETPVEVAELISLPSLVVEGELSSPSHLTTHPLSPEAASGAGSPLPVRAVASAPALSPLGPPAPGAVPAAVAVPAPGGDGTVRDPAAPEVLVNRVSYPSQQAGGVQGHGMCLSASDLDRITIFISEMCIRGLMPHVERQMRALSDVVNNRKGVSRSLISATKRWFGGNKPGAAAANSVIYSHEAPEIQVRRLGDLAFMFGHYDLAYQAYHTAKRDFNADAAWLHFAGAVEMAALSVFLHGAHGKPFPQHYLDQAVTTYLDTCSPAGSGGTSMPETVCGGLVAVRPAAELIASADRAGDEEREGDGSGGRRFRRLARRLSATLRRSLSAEEDPSPPTGRMPNYALRATLFSTECLKDRAQFTEAALQFIRLTAEDADLRSALLLEQAAHCFLNSQPPALRKYAFHMILSGHRFSKAGQRRHALRAYKQAAQVYEGHGWRLADDHIAFTLGRQSEALQEHEAARTALGSLLAGAAAVETRQSPAQQAAFVREYLHVIRQQCDSSSAPGARPPQLPVPHLLSQQTRVLVSPAQQPPADGWTPASGASFADEEEDNAKWFRLEELCLERLGQNSVPFKPTIQCMSDKTNNRHQPRVPASGEGSSRSTFSWCCVTRCGSPWSCSDLRLQYIFSPAGGRGPGTGRDRRPSPAHTLSRCTLEENATQEVTLSITAHEPGDLTILGYEFSLSLAAAPADSEPPPAGPGAAKEAPPAVRGCQPITVRGRRLNGTKEERSGVFYAEDKRLQLRVEEASAQLQLSFCGLPSSLLCGQIHPVLVRLTNSGRRPLLRLMVATPDPHLLALELSPPPDGERWSQVRGGPPPAAGRLCWAQAARLGRVTEVPLPEGGLVPGGCLLRRLWLRAPHADGPRPLELLVCGAAPGPGRPRLLRHAGRLLVTPSAAVSVRPSRSVGPRQSLHLDIQVSGVQPSAAPIVLERVAVAAPGWRLDRTAPVDAAEVQRGETAYLGVVVDRVPVRTAAGDGSTNPTAANDELLNIGSIALTSDSPSMDHKSHQQGGDHPQPGDSDSGLSEWPCVQFLLRHKLQLPPLLPPQSSGPTGAAPEPPSAEGAALAAAVRVDATVLLQWRTQGVDAAGRETTVYGQHHVTAELLDDSSATYPSAAELEPLPPVTIIPSRPPSPPPPHWPGEGVMDRLVTVVPLHRPAVNHNFDRKRLCVIPVTMLVQNHSRCDLVVHLSTVPVGSSSSRRSLPYSSHISSDLVWVGRTHPHVTVPAGGSARLPLAAAVTRPGLYDLGSVGVACRRAGADATDLTEQSAHTESAVVVRRLVETARAE
ncbi:Trafficking protein particle complex subunit 8 [Amphibalanus amphitrite]|uniref:Trafficking protein particle complex subunit 8 n=1 Tax=Amphibalanus amphitrite TaxID=1232801 RepID=A0A6A4W7S1_AMPAM|nr:Trafficking protein particle complex subunit 8 [Amphibalanus amphitrite]KAF0297931.1 Trafficking protein particle complex subunit 8 [Amphibalanus amphitrite]